MKKSLLISSIAGLLGLILLAPSALAAIGFDAQGSLQNINLTNVDISVTVTSSQANQVLLMKIFGSKSVSSVIYNGSNLTLQVATTTPTVNSSTWAIYSLIAPSTGTHNATVTFSGNSNPFFVCWESWYNVNQTTPVDATSSAWVSATSTGGIVSSTLTTLNANDIVSSFAADNGPAGSGVVNPAPNQGDTVTCSQNTGGLHAEAAYRTIPTAGATSTTWIQGTSTWYGMAAVSLVPAGAAVTVPKARGQIISMDW